MACGALALALAACAPGGGIGAVAGPASPATTAPGPAAGPVVTVVGLGCCGSPRTLNPLLDGADTEALDLVGGAAFAAAYRSDPATGEILPEALVEIPSVANGAVVARADGTVAVTYRVSSTARWADGRPITAADLLFTWQVATDPAQPIRKDVRARYAAVVAGSVAADGLTLDLVMSRGGDPALLFDVILPEHQVRGTDFGRDWNGRMWLGGGPFSFASWQPGEYLLLRRNPHYQSRDPGEGAARLPDEVVYRFFPQADGRALAEAFAGRLVDVAVLPSSADLSPYAALAEEGAVVATAPGLSWQALVFQFGPANRNGESLNGEMRFRSAVASAIDRGAIAAMWGTEPVESIYAECRADLAAGAWAGLLPDRQRVSDLLKDLGGDLGADLSAGDGPRLVLSVSADDAAGLRTAEALGEMLRSSGIGAEVQVEEGPAFHGSTLPDGAWDVALLTFSCGPGLAGARALARWFDPAAVPGRGANLARWGASPPGSEADPAAAAYADLMARLSAAADEESAADLLRRAEASLASARVIIPLAGVGPVGVAYWSDAATGAGPAGSGIERLARWHGRA